jgi:hypothetical protein
LAGNNDAFTAGPHQPASNEFLFAKFPDKNPNQSKLNTSPVPVATFPFAVKGGSIHSEFTVDNVKTGVIIGSL